MREAMQELAFEREYLKEHGTLPSFEAGDSAPAASPQTASQDLKPARKRPAAKAKRPAKKRTVKKRVVKKANR